MGEDMGELHSVSGKPVEISRILTGLQAGTGGFANAVFGGGREDGVVFVRCLECGAVFVSGFRISFVFNLRGGWQ